MDGFGSQSVMDVAWGYNYCSMEKKCLLIPFLGSLFVFLLTCWNAAFSSISAMWAESVSFFLFTYYMLEKYAEKDTYGIPVVFMIMLGRIILEIPIRMALL